MTTTEQGPLLIPIAVQAMVLNNTAVPLVRAQMNYTNLESCQSPSPAPFQQDDVRFSQDTRNHGVYLQWTLPDALRHGIEQADGRLAFPPVPNRWLVVRIYRPAAGGAAPAVPQVAAWVVESDFLHATGGANYVDPAAAVLSQTQIGRKLAITAAAPWTETATGPSFLRAVAESNPSFAAYQPFNTNVFSIHDDLTQQGVGTGSVSYFVQGWLAHADSDPLAAWPAGPDGPSFTAALDALKWTASAAGTGTHATVYHGGACGVAWVPNASSPPPSPKDSAHPRIAVGNTSVDAVVAFAMAAFAAPGVTPPAGLTPERAADLLEAFQYNLVDVLSQPDGEDRLERAIRSQWFGAASAGTRWAIVAAPLQPGLPSGPAATTEETAAETAWLGALNTAQQAFDVALRDLMGTQRRLFELWWKERAAAVILSQTGSEPWLASTAALAAALDPADPAGPIAHTRAVLATLQGLASQIPSSSTEDLDHAIETFAAARHLPPSRLLKAVSQPRFWTAGDPVVVLSGTASTQTITSDKKLTCRWPAEIVTAVTVATGGAGAALHLTSAQLMTRVPGPNWTNLPGLSSSLFAEFCLLDPANAPLAAAAAGHPLAPAEIDAVTKSLRPPAPDTGLAPAVLAPYPWTQPWIPLYLDWHITWYPIALGGSGAATNWAFNGTDYELATNVPQPTARTLSGRSVLTPQPSFAFKARIDQFIHDNPDSPASAALQAVENLIATVDGWDFVSQTLGGLSTRVASWNPVPTLLPPAAPVAGGRETMADLIGQQAQRPPDPQLATPGRAVPPSSFEGVRAGQFAFARVSIVDAFGQVLEIVTSQTAPQTAIITGRGLGVTRPITPIDTAGLAQLPPRLLQPARLNFQFETQSSGTPILGWFLPNHLDRGLSVYGADGSALGTLAQAADAHGQAYVSWWPAPDTPYATVAALAAAQPRLGGIVHAIAEAGPIALRDLLLSIDETMWTVDPLGDRSDTFLSVLLGRPLAVVAATLSVELQADVWRDPAWPYTFASPQPDPAFLGIDFPVRLGNVAARQDGLLGYFLDGNWARCNVVHVPEPPPDAPPAGSYLAAVGPGNWVDLRFAARGQGAARQLTLIMDPRASVHAQCGIFPVKDIALVPDWVDQTLDAMKVTFRSGPLLAEVRAAAASDTAPQTESLLIPSPAERHGTWEWRQLAADGSWPAAALGPSDAVATFPETPPILRHGVLQLSGGLDK